MSPPSVIPPIPKVPELSGIDVAIESARLSLRMPREEDVEDLWPWLSDPAFPRMMSWTAHVDKEESKGFVRRALEARAANVGLVWVIVHEGKACGVIGLEGMQFQLRAWRVDRAELGYWLAPPLWGQGLMTEAAFAVVRFGFEVVGLHKVTVQCIEENEASRRVIEKVGFRQVGRLEEDVWRDGRWLAHLRYEMLVGELVDDTTSTRRFVRR